MNIIEVRLNAEKSMMAHQDTPNGIVSIFEMDNNGAFRGVAQIPAERFATILANLARES